LPEQVKTTEAIRGRNIRHFSVFLPNRVGALLDLTNALAEANVHICGMDVLGSADAAVVRIVVDDPARCKDVLVAKDIAAAESTVLAVELPQGPEKLDLVLRALLGAELNVEYAYSLMVRPRGKAVLAMRVQDEDFACEVLRKAGFAVLSQSDISR
jgi:hypothetical protein